MYPQPSTLAVAIQHHQAGRLPEAESLYRQILAVEPANVDALHLLGVIAYQFGHHEVAIQHIEAAIRLRWDNAQMYNNLGTAYHALGRLVDAQRCYTSALELQPALGSARYNLGNLYLKARRFADAIACYHQVLPLQPGNREVLINLGNALQGQGEFTAAADCFEQVLHSHPGMAEVHVNLGSVREAQGRLDEAIVCYRQALAFSPDLAEAYHNLGGVFHAQGRLDDAADAYRAAMQRRPDYADARFGLGVTQLMQGDWLGGWREYEWRWRTARFTVPSYALGRGWDGGDLAGRTIVLYAEQGLGDTLQFVRYVPLVQQRGGRVLIHCQDCLAPLLLGVHAVEAVIPHSKPMQPADCATALLSLPALFATTPDTIPCDVPYLHADPARRARWRSWLDEQPGRKVGVCWQGNPLHADDARRSIALAALAPLAQVPGVRLVALQPRDGRDQLAQHGEALRLLDPGVSADEAGIGFLELAALLCELDLVVTVDTAVVHLAGALGVPTWLALAFQTDWRWLVGRADTPWYPTVRLFRQTQRGDWPGVIARLAQELALRECPTVSRRTKEAAIV
jgi:tetratricopeptide (TPR) repeat protein